MKTFGIVSMKGGVGKTTFAANLASCWTRSGKRVALVDLDPQNMAGWHFPGFNAESKGIAASAVRGEGLGSPTRVSEDGPWLFSYGHANKDVRGAFERMLRDEPHWLARRLRELHGQYSAVIVDSPPGQSSYLRQVLQASDHAIILMLPDLSSMATVPDMERMLDSAQAENPLLRSHYVVNQLDPGEALSRDMLASLISQFGQRLLPTPIHRDEAVPEALAMHLSVGSSAESSQAAHDLSVLASRLERVLES